MRIYLSGLVGPIGMEEAKMRFSAAKWLVEARGHDAVNPLDVVISGCDNYCVLNMLSAIWPERSDFAGSAGEHTWGCWMKADLKKMLDCDAVAMLLGWQHSPGARLENYIATSVGIPVYDIMDVPREVRRRD